MCQIKIDARICEGAVRDDSNMHRVVHMTRLCVDGDHTTLTQRVTGKAKSEEGDAASLPLPFSCLFSFFYSILALTTKIFFFNSCFSPMLLSSIPIVFLWL